MTLLAICIVLLLINVPPYWHARNCRKLAQSRLDMALRVLDMERLMLAGEIKLGDVCHDRIYKRMIESQFVEHFVIDWKLSKWLKDSAEAKKFRENMISEQENNPALGRLINRFRRSCFCAFRHNRPFMSLAFMVWVAIFISGIQVIFQGLIKVRKAKENWEAFKQTVSDYYAIICMKAT